MNGQVAHFGPERIDVPESVVGDRIIDGEVLPFAKLLRDTFRNLQLRRSFKNRLGEDTDASKGKCDQDAGLASISAKHTVITLSEREQKASPF